MEPVHDGRSLVATALRLKPGSHHSRHFPSPAEWYRGCQADHQDVARGEAAVLPHDARQPGIPKRGDGRGRHGVRPQVFRHRRTVQRGREDSEGAGLRHAFVRSGSAGSRTSLPPGDTPAVALTFRQAEVLQLVAEGWGNKEIADLLKVSVKTVDFHRGRIMRKLGAHNVARARPVRRSVRHGGRIGLRAFGSHRHQPPAPAGAVPLDWLFGGNPGRAKAAGLPAGKPAAARAGGGTGPPEATSIPACQGAGPSSSAIDRYRWPWRDHAAYLAAVTFMVEYPLLSAWAGAQSPRTNSKSGRRLPVVAESRSSARIASSRRPPFFAKSQLLLPSCSYCTLSLKCAGGTFPDFKWAIWDDSCKPTIYWSLHRALVHKVVT